MPSWDRRVCEGLRLWLVIASQLPCGCEVVITQVSAISVLLYLSAHLKMSCMVSRTSLLTDLFYLFHNCYLFVQDSLHRQMISSKINCVACLEGLCTEVCVP